MHGLLLAMALLFCVPAHADITDTGDLNIRGQGIIGGTMTVQGSAFSVGGAITASSATLTASGANTYSLTLSSSIHLTGGGVVWPDGTRSTTATSGSGSGVGGHTISTGAQNGPWTNLPGRTNLNFDSNFFVAVDSSSGSGTHISLSTFSNASTRQVFTSGNGTYTTPAGAIQIRIRMVGGGGGSAGAYGGSTAGGNGGASSFGTVVASSGIGSAASVGNYLTGTAGGAGGTGTASFRVAGGGGGVCNTLNGGVGGNSIFGGGGYGGIVTTDVHGSSGAVNSGGGAGGVARDSAAGCTSGGSAGEYAEIVIANPATTYPYVVGAGGVAGAGSVAGATGGSGIIIVDEFYPAISNTAQVHNEPEVFNSSFTANGLATFNGGIFNSDRSSATFVFTQDFTNILLGPCIGSTITYTNASSTVEIVGVISAYGSTISNIVATVIVDHNFASNANSSKGWVAATSHSNTEVVSLPLNRLLIMQPGSHTYCLSLSVESGGTGKVSSDTIGQWRVREAH